MFVMFFQDSHNKMWYSPFQETIPLYRFAVPRQPSLSLPNASSIYFRKVISYAYIVLSLYYLLWIYIWILYIYMYICTLGAGGSPKVLWVGYCEWLKIVISLWRNVSFWRSHSLHRIVICADEIFLIRVLIDQKSIIHTFIFVRNVCFVW